MSDAIRNRIRKLLDFGEDKRGNEEECGNALALAAKLMAEYGISQEEVRRKSGDKETPTRGDLFSGDRAYMEQVAVAAATLYGTKALFWGHEFMFFGRAELIAATQETYKFICDQIEAAYKVALPPGLTKGARSRWRTSFKNAAAMRVLVRAHQIVKDMVKEGAEKAATSNALTVLDYRQQLDVELEEMFAGMGVKNAKKSRGITLTDNNAAREGIKAGSNVQLNKQVKI
ncbi:MAG: DUF2786 domain-containing protein [Phycisphaerales bacterium]